MKKSRGLFFVILVVAIVFTACASSSTGGKVDNDTKEERVTFTWMVSEHPNNPVRDDWEVFEEIAEKTNVEIKFQPVPEANYFEKRKLVIASNELPDIMTSKLDEANDYGPQGAYLALNDIIENSDNIKNALSQSDIDSLKAIDGKVYAMPTIYDSDIVIAWLVRKDILDKNNIEIGTTAEDFYNMLKQLKEKYPDLYPMNMRYNLLETTAATWSIGDNIYFDRETEEFKFGPFQPEYKEMIKFFNRLYQEKLLDPEYAVSSSKNWEEKITNEKTFVTVDNYTRSDFFTNLMKDEIPEFNFAIMAPPTTNKDKPMVKGNNKLYNFTSFSSKIKDVDALFRLLDYLYSEEGQILYNWGIEGKTYKRENGKIVPMETLKNARTGKGTIELWRDMGAGPFIPTVERPDETGKAYKLGNNSIAGIELYQSEVVFLRPNPNIAFEKEELDTNKRIMNDVNDYIRKNVDSFIIQEFDDEKFEAFVNKLKEFKTESVIEVYNKAYKRQYK